MNRQDVSAEPSQLQQAKALLSVIFAVAGALVSYKVNDMIHGHGSHENDNEKDPPAGSDFHHS